MNKTPSFFITVIFTIMAFSSKSQSIFYTNGGRNPISQDSVNRLIEAYQQKQPKGKYVSAEIRHKEEKGDSIIFHWTYSISSKEPNNLIVETPELKLVGETFPNFKISSDSLTELKSFYGTPVFINFWFTACEPCVAEMDVLNGFKTNYQDEMVFIAVTFEDQEKVNDFLKHKPFDFIMHTGDFELLEKLGLDKSYPRNIILNERGEIVRVFGGVPYTIRNGEHVIGKGEAIEKEILKVISSSKEVH